jgi:MFS family permease
MIVFATLAVLLGGLFCIHLVWWRVHLPRRQRSVLLALFIGGGLLLAPAAGWLAGLAGLGTLSWIQWLNVALGVVAFALAYVVTYSALEADSPTLSLLRFIEERGRSGATFEELTDFINRRPFVAARLGALIEEDMLVEEGGRYRLSQHPYTLFRLVLCHRETILGIKEQGG